MNLIHRDLGLTLAALLFSGLAPAATTSIAPGVYLYKDTCNVYALVKNKHALLIDFGSGGILRELPNLGVEKADWILHTHFHRDQCQGDAIARAQGIRIAAPESERTYFDAVEQMWQRKRVFDNYDSRNEFFALRDNLPIDRGLKPGDRFDWEGLRINAIRATGHTEGSLAYSVERDGKLVLFCGDAAASPGKVPTVYDLELESAGPRGFYEQTKTLNRFRSLNPDLLLPSHGTPWHETENAMVPLISALAVLYDGYNGGPYSLERADRRMVPLTPHVWQSSPGDTSYVIVADSGLAFVWDAGGGAVTQTFLENVQKKTGFKRVDAISISHVHDDHTSGVETVRQKFGGKVWVEKHMVDVLEHPIAHNLLCLWGGPIKVDRVLEDGEKIVWEGIPLQFFYLPGQTEYAEGMLADVDGKRLMFIGDNCPVLVPERGLKGHIRLRDLHRLDTGHAYSAKKLLELKPDYLVPAHFEMFPATHDRLASYLASSERVDAAYRQVLGQPDPMFGLDNNWLSVYPYQVEANPGDSVEVQVRYRNYLPRRSTIHAELRGPSGWNFSPPAVEFAAAAKSEAAAPVKITIARDATANRRYVLTVDATRDGDHLGEVTEMLVNALPMRAH